MAPTGSVAIGEGTEAAAALTSTSTSRSSTLTSESSSGMTSGSDSAAAACAALAAESEEYDVRRQVVSTERVNARTCRSSVDRSSGVGSGGVRAASSTLGPPASSQAARIAITRSSSTTAWLSGTGAIPGRRPKSIRWSGESGVLRSAAAYHATTCDCALVIAT